MTRTWITTSSTNVEAVVNPIAAACKAGFVPDHLHLLENPGVTEQVQQALEVATTVVTAHGGDEPEVHLESLDSEVDFAGIYDYFETVVDAVEADDATGAEIAVDITPGRKFMSAIAFVAGMELGVDHVYYLHVDSGRLSGAAYPELPRTAATLYDFTEEL